MAEPVKALKGFRRITLQAGETRTVTFRLGPDALALYDRQMRRVVEPGTFTVFVGTSSDAVLSSRFEVMGNTLAKKSGTATYDCRPTATYDYRPGAMSGAAWGYVRAVPLRKNVQVVWR